MPGTEFTLRRSWPPQCLKHKTYKGKAKPRADRCEACWRIWVHVKDNTAKWETIGESTAEREKRVLGYVRGQPSKQGS